MVFDEKETFALLSKALDFSQASSSQVILEASETCLFRFAKNQIHQNTAEENCELTVWVKEGKRQGTFTTNQLDDASLTRAAEEALRIARLQREEPDMVPFPQPQTYQAIDTYSPEATQFLPEKRTETIKRVVALCCSKGLDAYGALATRAGVVAIVNSEGLKAFHPQTRASFTLTALSEENSSGWAEAEGTNMDALDIEAQTLRAIEKAELGRNPINLDPGRYTVILEESAVASLALFLSYLGFGAMAYQEGRSFMSNRLREPITGQNITISDDAYHPLAIGMPFDYEGIPRQKVTLIEKGVARAVVYDLTTASRDGVSSTGHALPPPNPFGPYASNLVIESGNMSISDMIRATKRGLLITRFWYNRVVDPKKTIITGMSRDGTFLIEDGHLVKGVKDLRFNESVLEAFGRAEMLSASPRLSEGVVTPAMKITDFKFTGSMERD